jgi:hypothetical protein
MRHSIRKASRRLVGAAIAGTLGFGAAQALAQPAPAATAPLCTVQQCTLACIQRGYAAGICNPDAQCVCLGAP